MSGTELLTELTVERTRLLAEVARLNAENSDLAALLRTQGCQMLDQRDRITALEAALEAALEEYAPRDMTGAEFVEHLKRLRKLVDEREAENAAPRHHGNE